MLGLFALIFGRPERGNFPGGDYADFHRWIDRALAAATDAVAEDQSLGRFVADRTRELEIAKADHAALIATAERNGWDLKEPYIVSQMKRVLHDTPGLSERGRRAIASRYVEALLLRREEEGRPANLDYVVKRATSIDWSVLDLLYRLCGFNQLRAMFDAAARQVDPDEGPVANLSLLSQYLSRFMDRRAPIITGELLQDDGFTKLFYASYLFALWRRGESEYEDADDPFPRGRIPFLTIHQSKGLEFPVVVLGNLRKDDRGAQLVEQLVRPMTGRGGEPIDRLGAFDIMRMFYVALSRAKNLLILAQFQGRGQSIHQSFRQVLANGVPTLSSISTHTIPVSSVSVDDTPRTYSYTADYLHFLRCPRQYLIFRQFGFVPSRSQTMLFGTLVHRTMDDLHQWLIARRTA